MLLQLVAAGPENHKAKEPHDRTTAEVDAWELVLRGRVGCGFLKLIKTYQCLQSFLLLMPLQDARFHA